MFLYVPSLRPQLAFAYLINLWWGLNSVPICQLQQGLCLNSQQWHHNLTASPWWWNDGGKQKQPPELQMLMLEAVCCVEGVCFFLIVCGCTHTYSYPLMCVNICLHARVSGGYKEPSWEEEWAHSSWLSGAGGHTGTQRRDERLLCRCHPLGFSGPASKCHVWQLARCCSPTSCWQGRLLKDARVGREHRERPNGSNIKESCWLLSVIQH